MRGQGQGIVYVAELIDQEDPGRLTGRFGAHWESEDGRSWRPGPEGVPVTEAIAWARRQAQVVLVRLGMNDPPYSAGEREPHDLSCERWPERGMVVRPRPLGVGPEGDRQLVPWSVRGLVRLPRPADDGTARRVEEALSEADAIDRASVEATASALAVECELQAEGMSHAAVRTDALVEEAVLKVVPSLRDRGLLDITVHVRDPGNGGWR